MAELTREPNEPHVDSGTMFLRLTGMVSEAEDRMSDKLAEKDVEIAKLKKIIEALLSEIDKTNKKVAELDERTKTRPRGRPPKKKE